MTTPPIYGANYPVYARQQTMRDLLLVSSFGLWALLLGLTPVLAFHLLMST